MKINKVLQEAAEEMSAQEVVKSGEADAATVQNAEKMLGGGESDAVYSDEEGYIEQILSKYLRLNRRAAKMKKGFKNVLFVGPAGSGKTARIEAWAQHNNINLVHVKAAAMDQTDVDGLMSKSETNPGTAYKLSPTQFDALDNVPDSVLFLDEFNRAPKNVRATLLTLIQDHTIPDYRLENGVRYLKNFLFTIAAINPVNAQYNTASLDDAEEDRFFTYEQDYDNAATKGYLIDYINRELKDTEDPEERKELRGQIKLVDTLLSSPDFRFDNAQDIDTARRAGYTKSLSSRSFQDVIEASGGTKEGLLDVWNNRCNPLKKSMIEDILANYQDVEDEATDTLKNHRTRSSMFKKKETAYDKLMAHGLDLGL